MKHHWEKFMPDLRQGCATGKPREDETPVGMQEKEYHSDFRKAPDGSTLVKASGILTKQAVAAASR
jgi:hypothetical protein